MGATPLLMDKKIILVKILKYHIGWRPVTGFVALSKS